MDGQVVAWSCASGEKVHAAQVSSARRPHKIPGGPMHLAGSGYDAPSSISRPQALALLAVASTMLFGICGGARDRPDG
jgi:hypothetical protein